MPQSMAELRGAVIVWSALTLTACEGLTTILPASPSSATFPAVKNAVGSTPALPVGPDVPAGLVATTQSMTGSVGPLTSDVPPCYLERYACEKFSFTMQRDGAVEVTLTWSGNERAMLIQLYRAGGGLVHEDLAPRGGPPQITFRRTDITSMEYELRVVNMEPFATHSFDLRLTTWE